MAMVLAAFAGFLHANGIDLIAGSARNETAPAGEARTYRLTLQRGQATEIALRQRDAVGLELRWATHGAQETTSLATEAGRESIVRTVLIAPERTTWDLVVAPSRSDRAFHYAIAVTAAHPATKADHDRAAAVTSLAEAQALRAKADKDLAPQARTLYHASIDAWRSAGDSCGARNTYVALAGLEHEVVDAAAQKAAAQAALDQPCETGVADRALAERLLGSAYINQGDFASGTRETERAVASF